MGAVLAVVFEASVVLVMVTSVRRRAARMRAAANARRARLARVPIRAAARKDDGPQDAIPAGYPAAAWCLMRRVVNKRDDTGGRPAVEVIDPALGPRDTDPTTPRIPIIETEEN